METNKDVYSSLCEREILESLNNIVEVYLEVEDIVDKEIYQGELAKKFIAKSGFNFFKSGMAASASLIASTELFDYSPSGIQTVVAITTASLTGYFLFQKANRREFMEKSLDTEEYVSKVKSICDRLYVNLEEFDVSVNRYIDNSDFTFDDFVENDFMKDIFDNNRDYIENRKSMCDYDFDFDYDSVSEVFNDCFNLKNGVNEYLIKNRNKSAKKSIYIRRNQFILFLFFD